MPTRCTMHLLVTRPQPQADAWVAQLQNAGLQASALPLLAMGPPPDLAPLRLAWTRLDAFALVMFVSPHAVAAWFEQAPAQAIWPACTLAGASGLGTRQALAEQGVPDSLLRAPAADSATFDTDALWQQQLQALPWAGRQVLLVRGDGGRDTLAERLRDQGAQVQVLQAYVRLAPQWTAAQQQCARQALAYPQDHAWLASSSQALAHLPSLLPGADFTHSRAIASHPRIAETARALGFGRVDTVVPGLQPLLSALGLPVPNVESSPDGP